MIPSEVAKAWEAAKERKQQPGQANAPHAKALRGVAAVHVAVVAAVILQPVQKVLVFIVAGFQLHSLFGVFQSVYAVAKAAAGQGCIIIPAGAALTDGNGFQHVHGLGVMARIDIVSGGLHTGVLVREIGRASCRERV